MEELRNEMMERNEMSRKVIKELREKCFLEKIPFLHLSGNLPEGHAYYEYPNGRIEIREVHELEGQLKTELVRELTIAEANDVKAGYGM